MNTPTKRRYGLDFPAETPDVLIDLLFAKKWREEPYKFGNHLDPWEHLLRACRVLFTPEEFSISPWTEEHALDWTTEKFCITWGGASCSKSNDYGLFCLLDWIVDPTQTVTILTSTTREMLKMRAYESVGRYFGILKRDRRFSIPGKESKTSCAILNSTDADDESGASSDTIKASIRGIAVNDGGKPQGAHLPYVRFIMDEMALMKQATFDARVNLSIGAGKDFKFIGLANPESLFDLSARYSVPLGGWDSIDADSTEWRCALGKVRHHNGFNSPAITDPEGRRKFPYLVNQEQIDDVIKGEHGNEDAPAVWTMIRGFPPPQGLERTVLTESDLVTYAAQTRDPWAAGIRPVTVAALDAAFTHDGDGCTLHFADVGRVAPGVPAIVFGDMEYLTIESSSKKPVLAQIVDQVREHLAKRNVPINLLACDDSGTQSVADALEIGIGPGVVRYNYVNKATEALTIGGRDKFCDRYADIITELYVLLGEFVRSRQVRGMHNMAAKYATMRRFIRRAKNAKVGLESKKEFKKRTGGRSPDEGDVEAMIAGLVRDVLGFSPGKFPERFHQPVTSLEDPMTGRPYPRRPSLRSNYTGVSSLRGYK